MGDEQYVTARACGLRRSYWNVTRASTGTGSPIDAEGVEPHWDLRVLAFCCGEHCVFQIRTLNTQRPESQHVT